ncbi:MAG: sigma factor-like helix-turn-helix DNA-binding protein [Planctomycetaceae bacterium]
MSVPLAAHSIRRLPPSKLTAGKTRSGSLPDESSPGNEAEIVKQYHLEGRSYREISAALGVPENTIGPTLTRARSRMKDNQVRS